MMQLLLNWFILALGFITAIPPNQLDGGSGGTGGGGIGGTGGGGGTPGTPTGSSQGPAIPFGENGGVVGGTYFLFVPVQGIGSLQAYIAIYDITNFNDPVNASSYSYRVEDINQDRVPTVNRLVVTYRDLGLAKISFTLTGTNDKGAVVSKSSSKFQIGNAVPTNALLTLFVDLQLTAFRPQLTINRAAGDGPVSIVAVTMRGEVELNQ